MEAPFLRIVIHKEERTILVSEFLLEDIIIAKQNMDTLRQNLGPYDEGNNDADFLCLGLVFKAYKDNEFLHRYVCLCKNTLD
jgi:hypothetical protein